MRCLVRHYSPTAPVGWDFPTVGVRPLITFGRANVFFIFSAVGGACSVVGPAISASLMRRHIWDPIWLGLALQVAAILATFWLPETLNLPDDNDGVSRAVRDVVSEPNSDISVSPPTAKATNDLYDELVTSAKAVAIVFRDWRMAVLAGLYPVHMMQMALLNLLPRYISYRYHWSLTSAIYLLSLLALGSTLCLFVLLPIVSDQLGKTFQLNPTQNNAVLARFSLGFLALSFLWLGLAPTIPTLICGLLVGTLGAGAGSALRALAGSLIDHKDTGKVFTGLVVAETIGMVAAFPAVAGLYNAGIEKGGGAWLGIPYEITGLIVALSAMVMCFLNFETRPPSRLPRT